ncbi:hypothetical protein ACH4KN_09840 [Streptomyces sp. NPDC017546]|uniref:hypothetical protein n=1 Tax=Streptomyces sp. NPDC017546 TaxID=3365001 RepID=UPI0037AE141B
MTEPQSCNATIAAGPAGDTPGAGPASPSGPAPGPAFALLGIVQMSLLFTLTSLVVPLPRIGRAFSLDRTDLILLTSAYGLAFSGLLLFGGRVADRFGGRRALTAGPAGAATGLALIAFTGLEPHHSYAYGLLPGLLTLGSDSTSLAATAVLLTVAAAISLRTE